MLLSSDPSKTKKATDLNRGFGGFIKNPLL